LPEFGKIDYKRYCMVVVANPNTRILAISLSPDYLIIALLCYVQIVSHLKYKSGLVLGAGQVVYTN